MVNNIITSPFEHEIQQLLAVSEPRESFREDLYNQLQTQTPSRANQPRSLILKPAFIAILIAILMFAASLFYFGPETVYAAITRLFDYIPGIGLVDQDAQIRVLKEPVSQTRDGITITVNEAFLTEDRTEIHYGVSGVPLSAYPRNEASYEGSLQPDYLLLPDGRRLEMGEPIPADVNEAILMIPCIFNTLPDTVPTNWEFPLEFIPLPEDATIYPVQESTAQPEKTSLPKPESRITQESTDTDEQKKDGVIHIEKTIQTDTGYILIGSVEVNSEQDAWINMQGMPQISDADNTKIPVTFPYDIQLSNTDNNAIAWAGQFDAADVTFPITLTMYGEKFSKVTSESPIRIPFNAGESPQPGQEWHIGQDFNIGDYRLRLETIRASDNGYSFTFDTSLNETTIMSPPSINIVGYHALGGGGGSSGISLIFSEIPKGQLELEFSDLFVRTDQYTWKTQWAPENLQIEWPEDTIPARDVCINEENYQTLTILPESYSGIIIRTELNPEVMIAATDLAGNNRTAFDPGSNRGSLSPDGSQLVYAGQDGMHLIDLASGEKTILPGLGSHELRWSPDGNKIALVNPYENYGIYIASLDDTNLTQVSNLGYEAIAGWSPDGQQIYYAIPGSSQAGSLLKRYDLASRETIDLFLLENSSSKLPMPRISPDGKWIAYRGSNSSQAYLISIDGSQSRLVLSLPADQFTISGIQWERTSGLLAISATNYSIAGTSQLFIMEPESCTGYTLDGFSGELNGILFEQE